MVTKRKPTPEDPVQTTRKLVDKIREELSCTEAEAYFTLRCIASPPTDSFFAYKIFLAARLYREKKKCSKEEAVSFAAAHPELERAITPWDWAIFFTRGLMGQLEEYRKRVEKGHFASFLRAIEVCGFDGFPLPMWIRKRDGNAHAAYSGHRAGTLDEAFDAKRPGKYHRATSEWRTNTLSKLHLRCKELLAQGEKTGAETGTLFKTVGGEFGISQGTARKYYYAWKNIVEIPDPMVDALLEPFKLPSLDDRPKRRRGRPPGMKGGKKKPAE